MALFHMKNSVNSLSELLSCDRVSFTLFSQDEIRDLCVTKICTPLTFDALGYPYPGGLYDKTLGPVTEKSEPCATCAKNYFNCPGHFGYIELPLPTVNPIFHKTIATILKITCHNCFQIQIPGHLKCTLTIQMKLLNFGLVTEANEIGSRIQDLILKYESLDNIPEESMEAIKDYEKLLTEQMHDNVILNKNIEALRNSFISDMFKQLKPRKFCMHCKQILNKIQTFKNKIIIGVTTNKIKDGDSMKVQRFKTTETMHLNAKESRRYMREIWLKEKDILLQIVPVLNEVKYEYPTDLFYFEVIPVPPPNVRPVNMIRGQVTENEQSQIYKSILQNSMILRAVIQVVKNNGDPDVLPQEAKEVYALAQGNTPFEKLCSGWDYLQADVDGLLDKENTKERAGQGLKQIIEKKQGIIRMHMMGKRVNFAARSVITPDPNLNIDEIGIPEEFAKQLTYPVPVTSWNVEELRKMIMNGPLVHPGAVMVEFEDGSISRINPKNKIHQKSMLKRLLTPDEKINGFRGVKRVHRHLCNGDILLLNRQPTLHKPSIMAHTARILKGEKTIRLHYANCKAYNADFDGDEMNAHFPQNELARSEGYTIANVSNQYLVPKDGTPLSGLIQDHMVSGVRLSIRGRFFSKDDYQQLVFQALSQQTSDIILLPPAILKPVYLWSGKQILSTVIINIIPRGKEPINLTATSKITAKEWESSSPRQWKAGGTPFKDPITMSEAEVIIRKGELLVGILDKKHYGATPYSLIHCIFELYGGTYATKLLSAFAKLFMRFLQTEGFTLGVHDILVLKKADKKRTEIIKEARMVGKQAITQALGLDLDTPADEIVKTIEQTGAVDPKLRAVIDRQYKSALDSYTNSINRTCLPAGLLCKFPQNNLQLMVQSGAKGSTVNTMQISCLLGQIELEGKRPPVMICGKSLPSFPAFEFSPRAGGFIDGRFMTGIQPQEFFFHCMAGREGLIDTAVKTSRSGYLQRCLIKHLEGLTVAYDLTVRDSDKSVIQFAYGEDGMDISKVQFLNEKQLSFLAENCKAVLDKDTIKSLKEVEDYKNVEKYNKKLKVWKENHRNQLGKQRRSPFTMFSSSIKKKLQKENLSKVSSKTGRTKQTKLTIEIWKDAGSDIKEKFISDCESCPDPVNSIYQPDCYFGSINERLLTLMDNYKDNRDKKEKKDFQNMLKLKSMQSLCAPGESVGLLAAQSIGEPSTQMTLNTFHFAGRGEMNVTLGIPRLREILMMASQSIKTPSMEIPFLNVPNLEKRAENMKKILNRVVVADVLEKIDVTTQLEIGAIRQQKYTLRFCFLPHHLYKSQYHTKPKTVLKHMTRRFFSEMFTSIKKYSKIHSNLISIQDEKKKKINGNVSDDENNDESKIKTVDSPNGIEDSSDEEPEDTEDAKQAGKYQEVHDSQEPEEDEEKELSDDETNEVNNEDDTAELSVVNAYNYAQNYTYDTKNYLWCELTFSLPLTYKKLDMTAILKDVATKSVIWQTPSIKRAITYMKNDVLTLRTDGINMVEMFKYHDLLDLNKLYSNDIHKVAQTYGIEAAARVIVREVRDVFNVYGITVDPRHLLLIADYMTFNGTFEPMSRKGMESSASPFHQMSFESSLTFLKTATVRGKLDQLQNPSSCLIVGKPCPTGTGSFSLLQKHVIPTSVY